jgi:tetratricopeptide (TPR) repeat protein
MLLARDYAGLKQRESLAALVLDWNSLQEVSAASNTDFSSLLSKSSLDQQALEVLEKAKASGQVSVDLALALANLYFLKGDLSQAFESYEAALSLKPDCVDCLRRLAKIAEQQKDPEKALAYLIKAKRQQPDNPEILFEFGKACLELDLFEDAVPALQKAVRLRPSNDSYAYVLASAHVSKKEYEVAGKIFDGLLQKHPRDPVLNYAMGSLLFLEVKLDHAATYLRKSIELNPDQSAAYYYLGLVAEGKGQNEEVLRRDTEYGPAYEALGRILLKEQKYPEAKQALEKAVLLDPTSVKAHYQLGILLGRTGQPDGASKELAIVNELNAAETKRAGMRLRILTAH